MINIFKTDFNLKKASNEELDDAFVKLSQLYNHTNNRTLMQVITESLEVLSKEIQRRDNSLVSKFKDFFWKLKLNNKLRDRGISNV